MGAPNVLLMAYVRRMVAVTVAFWNRYWMCSAKRQVDWLKTQPWDVLLLAEVTPTAWGVFASLGSSVSALRLVGPVDDRRRPHGVAVVARNGWNLEGVRLLPRSNGDPTNRRERALIADVEDRSGTRFTALSWHAPNAAGRSKAEREEKALAKQRAYRGLWSWLREVGRPVVVGMDGNNWGDWSDLPADKPVYSDDPWKEENQFHGPDAEHGLVDTLRVAARRPPAQGDLLAVTKIIPSRRVRMDRIYVSRDVQVEEAGVAYAPGLDLDTANENTRLSPGSDHALVWARLIVGGGDDR